MMEDFKGMLEDAVAKIPKDNMQRSMWLTQRENELYNELIESGMDMHSLVGLLEKVKMLLIIKHEEALSTMQEFVKNDILSHSKE